MDGEPIAATWGADRWPGGVWAEAWARMGEGERGPEAHTQELVRKALNRAIEAPREPRTRLEQTLAMERLERLGGTGDRVIGWISHEAWRGLFLDLVPLVDSLWTGHLDAVTREWVRARDLPWPRERALESLADAAIELLWEDVGGKDPIVAVEGSRLRFVRLPKLEEVLLSAVGWGVTVLTAGFTVKPLATAPVWLAPLVAGGANLMVPMVHLYRRSRCAWMAWDKLSLAEKVGYVIVARMEQEKAAPTRAEVQRLWGRQKPNAVLSELDAEGIFRRGGRARGKGLWRIADWWRKNHDPVPRGAEMGVAAGYIVWRYGFVDARSVSSSAFGKKWQQVGGDLKRALGQLCTHRIDCADRRSLMREDNRRLSVEWELFSL